MAKKKKQKGNGAGGLAGLVLIGAWIAAVILPFFLGVKYCMYWYKAYRLRKAIKAYPKSWWITDAEAHDYKERYAARKAAFDRNMAEYEHLEVLIGEQHQCARNSSIPTNQDGSYSRRSNLGKEIQEKIEELQRHRKSLNVIWQEPECRQPYHSWSELNEILISRNKMYLALLGWVGGVAFFYAARKQGAPLDIWLGSFIPALTAGIGYLLGVWFCKSPATRYFPKPVYIVIENVDAPVWDLPQRNRTALRIAGLCVWTSLVALASIKGAEYGVVQAAAFEKQQSEEKAAQEKSVELDRKYRDEADLSDVVRTPPNGNGSALAADGSSDPSRTVATGEHKLNRLADRRVVMKAIPIPEELELESGGQEIEPDVLEPHDILNWDLLRVRQEINAVYARYGVIFPQKDIQSWAEKLPEYKGILGRTFDDAERLFTERDRHNVKVLAERRNLLKESDE